MNANQSQLQCRLFVVSPLDLPFSFLFLFPDLFFSRLVPLEPLVAIALIIECRLAA